MSNGTKIKGKWRAGEPVGALSILHSNETHTSPDLIREELPLNRKWSDSTGARYI